MTDNQDDATQAGACQHAYTMLAPMNPLLQKQYQGGEMVRWCMKCCGLERDHNATTTLSRLRAALEGDERRRADFVKVLSLLNWARQYIDYCERIGLKGAGELLEKCSELSGRYMQKFGALLNESTNDPQVDTGWWHDEDKAEEENMAVLSALEAMTDDHDHPQDGGR